MGNFTTPDMVVTSKANGNYRIDDTELRVNVAGTWRSRPTKKRLFSDDEIRAIRSDTRSQKKLALEYDCSHVLIFYIKKRAIYGDVV